MKKTTYILIGSLVAAAVLSFFLPVIFFSSRKAECVTLSRTGKNKEILPAHFASINVNQSDYSFMETQGDHSTLSLTVVESNNVDRPRITVDSSWYGNVEFNTLEGELNVSVTMDAALEALRSRAGGVAGRVVIAEDNVNVATITVPRGSLKQLQSSDMSMLLKDFVNADLHIVSSWGGIQAINSSFTTLNIH